MIFGRSRLELKVGLFVFVGVAILMIFVLLIGNFKDMVRSRRIDFLFTFTNGVKVGAPVRFAGVDVGEVKDLQLEFSDLTSKPKIRIVSWIRSDIKIPRDSTVWINTLGLLGEKYMEIMPGKDYANCLASDEAMTGYDPLAMHEIVNVIKDTVSDLGVSVRQLQDPNGTVGKLLHDDRLYNEMLAISDELKSSVAAIGNEMEGLVKDLRAHPWKLLNKPRGVK